MLEPIELFVAVDGSDKWTGKRPEPNADRPDGPFRTIGAAQRAIRAIKETDSGLSRPVNVSLRGGVHRLARPLRFGPADSGHLHALITYRACPGEQVTISGGRPITNWQPAGDGLWTADLPNVAKGKWAFVTNELDNTLAVYAYSVADGLSLVQCVHLLPDGCVCVYVRAHVRTAVWML